MNGTDEARQQAQRDHDSNRGPVNIQDSYLRQIYEGERERLRRQQEEQNNKNKG